MKFIYPSYKPPKVFISVGCQHSSNGSPRGYTYCDVGNIGNCLKFIGVDHKQTCIILNLKSLLLQHDSIYNSGEIISCTFRENESENSSSRVLHSAMMLISNWEEFSTAIWIMQRLLFALNSKLANNLISLCSLGYSSVTS